MIPPKVHAKLDAVSVAALIAGPLVMNWPSRIARPLALLGLGVAAYSILTRYDKGEKGVIDLSRHQMLDAAQGAVALGLASRESNPVIRRVVAGYGVFSLAAAALTANQGAPGIPLSEAAVFDSETHNGIREISDDLAYLRLAIVNIVFLGKKGAPDRGWVLIDAGVPGTATAIKAAATSRFGTSRPAAIVLTHGHFDHVGALRELAEAWDCPVYAHPEERPFLDGSESYPPASPEVGGGLMANVSPLFPRGPIDVADRLEDLPADGSLPFIEKWRWLHTPGHCPGHVSFWDADRAILIAGDAISSTRQESVYHAVTQEPELHGPPAYFTSDWDAAARSFRKLAELKPDLLITGHGPALQGPGFTAELAHMAHDFERFAVPPQGRYTP